MLFPYNWPFLTPACYMLSHALMHLCKLVSWSEVWSPLPWLTFYVLIDSPAISWAYLSHGMYPITLTLSIQGGQNLCHAHRSSLVQGAYIWLNWTHCRALHMLFLFWESSFFLKSLLQPCLPPTLLRAVTGELCFIFQETAYVLSPLLWNLTSLSLPI